MPPCRRPLPLALALAVVLAILITPTPGAAAGHERASTTPTQDVDLGIIEGGDGGPDDQLAAAALTDLEGFWQAEFPTISDGQEFSPPAGYFSVDSSRPGPPVPCLRTSQQIRGNAFYCPPADVLGYDRTALLPALREQFGDTAAVVVLAHEFGHAVQARLDPAAATGETPRLPTIVAEAQADCYSGAFLRQIRDGNTPNLSTDARGIDQAMAALVTFRDPVGTAAADPAAHGNAFDRVTSFQAGVDGDATACAGMTAESRAFTQTSFTSLRDQSNQGNLAPSELLSAMAPDLDRFFGDLVRGRSRPWTPPAVEQGPATCPADAAPAEDQGQAQGQGPVAFCSPAAGPPAVRVDPGDELAGQHRAIGDYATGTLLASRFGLAAASALGLPVEGPEAGRQALCLAGAYTGAVGDSNGGFGLSPGDLDEAVQTLLRSDRAAADTAGISDIATGYERVKVFRAGVTNGPEGCLDGAG